MLACPLPLRFDGTWWIGAILALVAVLQGVRCLKPVDPGLHGDERVGEPLWRWLAALVALLALGLAAFAVYADLTAGELPLAGFILGSAVFGLLSLSFALRVHAIPAALRTENERTLLFLAYALTFAVGGCYGLMCPR